MPRSITLFLLTSFIHHIASLSLPGPSLQIVNATTATATCTNFKLFQVRPLYRDCSAAIDRLSSSSVPGNFHARGAFDVFQLPLAEEVDTCVVTVTMRSSLGEPSSWLELKTAARRLGDECRVRKVFDVTGGTVKVGVHGWIMISLTRSLMGGEVAADG